MKKVICIFLLMAVACLPCFSCAESYEEEDGEWRGQEWLEWAEAEFKKDYGAVCHLENGTLTFLEGVITLGDYIGEYVGNNEYIEDPEITALFARDPIQGKTIDGSIFDFEGRCDFTGINWPDSLRMLGSTAFMYVSCEQLILPLSLERIYDAAFYRCYFDTVRIECCLPEGEIWSGFVDCRINAYEVPEDHPLYKTVDGVLYTKDGKTLLAYPNGREDEHFDVPAGVEVIDSYAFCNEYLKTVSLPIGLKALTGGAFYGCGRLQAITVPLTVEYIGEDVFTECVSLERVSLPEGLTADKDASWSIYYQDDSLFRGDNGDTLPQPRKDDDDDY